MTSLVINGLWYVYACLTAIKVGQWVLSKLSKEKKPKHVAERMEYTPSLQAAMFVFDCILPAPPSKVPRKDFRIITDAWVADFNSSVKNKQRATKSYDSVQEAKLEFYKEFVQDSGSMGVLLQRALKEAGDICLRSPLGLVSALGLLCLAPILTSLLLRDIFWCGGNHNSTFCKLAAFGSISDVYVMACQEGLEFEEALHKYPWLAGIFSKKQKHPMIGRNVCPIYQRTLVFPKDVLKCQARFVPCPSGVAIVEEVHEGYGAYIWSKFHDFAMPIVVVAYLMGHVAAEAASWEDCQSLATCAAVLYGVRTLADHSMGIKWLGRYQLMP